MRPRAPALLILSALAGCLRAPEVVPEAALRPAPAPSPPEDPPGPAPRHADADGPGWRVRDGVLESLHEALRVRPTPGWRLDLAPRSAPTGIGFSLIDERASIELAFHGLPNLTADVGARRREREASWMDGAPDPAPPLRAELGGDALSLVAGRGDDERLYGLVVVDGQPLEIRARYPRTGDPERLRDRVRAALAALEVLTAEERAALRAELERSGPVHDGFGEAWSLHGQIYVHYGFGVRVRLPSSVLQVFVGEGAAALGNGVQLVWMDPSRDLRGVLMAYPLDDPRVDATAWHEHARGFLDGSDLPRRSPPTRRRMGDAEAVVEVFDNPRERLRVHLASALHRGQALIMVIEAGPRGVDGSGDDLAALAAFAVADDLERARSEGGRHVDLHAGYAIDPVLEVPASTHVGTTTKIVISRSQWRRGAERVVAAAYHHGDALELATMPGFLATRKRAVEAVAGVRGDPAWTKLEEPRAAWTLRWREEGRRCDAALVVDRATIYEVSTCSWDGRLFERVLASFERVDASGAPRADAAAPPG